MHDVGQKGVVELCNTLSGRRGDDAGILFSQHMNLNHMLFSLFSESEGSAKTQLSAVVEKRNKYNPLIQSTKHGPDSDQKPPRSSKVYLLRELLRLSFISQHSNPLDYQTSQSQVDVFQQRATHFQSTEMSTIYDGPPHPRPKAKRCRGE